MGDKIDKPLNGAPSGQLPSVPELPDFGWRVPFSYECKIKCMPFSKPRLKQIPQYVGLGLRYTKFWLGKKRQGRRPYIDQIRSTKHKPIYGCPLGGLGSGTIGRGYRGEFCRFQMVPGIYQHHEIDADQFIVCIRKDGETVYQKVLSCAKKTKKKSLKSWDWSFPIQDATYHALYPRAWSMYKIPEFGVSLVCRQISPIIPHDYLESSLPSAAFVWEIKNDSEDDLDVSITFTFKNGEGTKEDRAGGVWCQGFSCTCDGDKTVKGVTINQQFRDMKCSYGIAAKATSDVSVSSLQQFNPQGDGASVWQPLFSTGQLEDDISLEPSPPTSKGEEVASAVCAKVSVGKHSTGKCEFSLSWDMPIIQFAAKENTYVRRYARLYGTEGTAAPQLCAHTLRNYPMWESKIEAWQEPILSSVELPAWYKSAIFNELYFISDGGSIWIDVSDNSVQTPSTHHIVKEYGRFAYLEGQEYRMYNTYDVHYYASFALLMLWPKLQLSLQYDYSDTVRMEDPERVKFLMFGDVGLRKVKECVPHDIGDPEDEPWKRVNCYNMHPTNDWKDLNIKFVVQVYRDYHATKDSHYLETMYPVCKCLIETSKVWDTDGDGLIDNGGYADQTFDAWVMKGASSYCGGIWLASLRMMVEMARLLNQPEDEAVYQAMLDKGKSSFEDKLWNGSCYNYDSSTSGHHDSVMADQLAGHWFLKATGLQDESIFPADKVNTALMTIFKNNVMGFGDGNMGAINGTRPNGSMDLSSPQSEEFWVGITYGLAATMVQEGMVEEGLRTAYGAHHTCWDVMGLHFQTPEAYTPNLNYRSLAYMRPLAIWAIQWAIEKFHPHMVSALTLKSEDLNKSVMTYYDGDQHSSTDIVCDTSVTVTQDNGTVVKATATDSGIPDITITPSDSYDIVDTQTSDSSEACDIQNDENGDVVSSANDDVVPKISSNDDVVPKISSNDDVVPKSSSNDDVVPKSSSNDDFVPKSSSNDDVVPKISSNDDIVPKISSNDDFVPKSSSNDDIVPKIFSNDDAVPKISSNDDVVLIETASSSDTREESVGESDSQTESNRTQPSKDDHDEGTESELDKSK